MKNLLLILSVFLSSSAFGTIYNISPSFTVDVPSNWTVSFVNESILLNSPSNSILGNLWAIPPSERTIFAVDYEALNLLLESQLLNQDLIRIDSFSSTGLYFKGMTEATYNFYKSSNNDFCQLSLYFADQFKSDILHKTKEIQHNNFLTLLSSWYSARYLQGALLTKNSHLSQRLPNIQNILLSTFHIYMNLN